MTNLLIETHSLTKKYGAIEAVRSLNLEMPAGSICGFLGKNGSGKSTTIKMLLGMTWPTSGIGLVFGHSIRDAAPAWKPAAGLASSARISASITT
jgi:ABC-2 type transport system ATP-binding protein